MRDANESDRATRGIRARRAQPGVYFITTDTGPQILIACNAIRIALKPMKIKAGHVF
jgi:hypothetical protein